MLSVCRVVVIDKVTDFLLFICKLVVVGIVGTFLSLYRKHSLYLFVVHFSREEMSWM